MLRLQSKKERKRKAKRKGGFDDTWYTKDAREMLKYTYDECPFCEQQRYPINDIKRNGRVIMSCKTGGCPGNAEYDTSNWDHKYKDLARRVDKDAIHDFKDLIRGTNPRRLWSIKRRIF